MAEIVKGDHIDPDINRVEGRRGAREVEPIIDLRHDEGKRGLKDFRPMPIGVRDELDTVPEPTAEELAYVELGLQLDDVVPDVDDEVHLLAGEAQPPATGERKKISGSPQPSGSGENLGWLEQLAEASTQP